MTNLMIKMNNKVTNRLKGLIDDKLIDTSLNQSINRTNQSTDQTDIDYLNEYVLIKVFNYLNIDDKLTCTKVCKRWQRILNSTICQPKKLSLTINTEVPIKELNNLNCDHFNDLNELITDNYMLKLIDHFDSDLLNNELFSNLNLLIINFIFIEDQAILDLSQLINLRHLEIHGTYYEFAKQTIYPSVEHLFIEKFKLNLFEHFPNLKCLCLNQLKIDQIIKDSSIDQSNELDELDELDEFYDQLNHTKTDKLKSNDESTNKFNRINSCNSLIKLKVNYVPVQSTNYQNDLMQLLSLTTPNLEQIYMCLSLCENDEDDDFESDTEMEINSSKLNKITDSNDLKPNSSSNLNSDLNSTSNLTSNLNNCTMDKMINLIRKLSKLKLVEIEFDLDHMTNLNSMNNFLLNITYELSRLKLKLNTHLKFGKSLDLNSTDRFKFSSFLKANYRNDLNEIIINGRSFKLNELNSLLKYYHLINVEELYITTKELSLFDKRTVYNYLEQVNALCFECDTGVRRLNEILTNLNQIKYIYFNCSTVNQEQINLIPILKADLEYLAIEEFTEHLDLDFAFKFNCLRSLYLGKLKSLNVTQLIQLIVKFKHLTYLNIECKLIGKSLDHLIKLYASNAQQSNQFYHLNLSLYDYQNFENFAKTSTIPNLKNLKINFYNSYS